MRLNLHSDDIFINFIKNAIAIVLLLFYNAISSIYIEIPPLFGLLFLYFCAIVSEKRYYSLFFFTLTLFICEADKGYAIGVLFVAYTIIYIFIFPKFVKTFENFNLFEFSYIFITYAIYVLLNTLLSIITQGSVDIDLSMIVWYIFLESLILVVMRWILDIK